MHLTFSEIAGARVGLTSAEAVALVLAAAREFDRSAASSMALPAANHILLTNTGRVSFLAVLDGPARDRVADAGALLRSLLGVGAGAALASRPQAPGALLLLLARAAGEIDLPALSYPAFLCALSRFGSPDEATLAAVYEKCVNHLIAVQNTLLRNQAGAKAALRQARGVNGLQASDPRRELRGAERELFAARRFGNTRAPRASGWMFSRGPFAARAVAASALLAAAMWMVDSLERRSPTSTSAAVHRTETGSTARELTAVEVRQPLVVIPPPPSDRSAPDAAGSDSMGPLARQHNSGVDSSLSAAPLIASSLVGQDIFSPSFSDDGQEVLFHAGRRGAALMRASFDSRGHAAVATLLQDGAANLHGALSPDGTRLAYDSDRDGTRAVYIARADASNPQKISGDGYAAVPRWSFDGRRLAFIRAELNRPHVWNVWVADLQSHTLSRVSHHRVGQAWGGSWFPDGNRIAYSVEDRLVIADLKGGTSQVLHAPRRGQLIRTPAVSPDGKWIVFQVHGDGVWLLDVPTMAMRRVLSDAAAEEFAWSPDGTRVAYHTRRQHAWSLWQLELHPPATG